MSITSLYLAVHVMKGQSSSVVVNLERWANQAVSGDLLMQLSSPGFFATVRVCCKFWNIRRIAQNRRLECCLLEQFFLWLLVVPLIQMKIDDFVKDGDGLRSCNFAGTTDL